MYKHAMGTVVFCIDFEWVVGRAGEARDRAEFLVGCYEAQARHNKP